MLSPVGAAWWSVPRRSAQEREPRGSAISFTGGPAVAGSHRVALGRTRPPSRLIFSWPCRSPVRGHHLFIGGLFSLSQALFWARFSHSGHCSLRPTSSPLPDSENLICCRTEVTSSYVLSVVRSGIESSEAKMPVHLRRWRSCGSPVTLAGAETSLTVLSVVSREDADGLTALLFLPSRALCSSPLARTVKPGNRSRHTGFRV